MNRTVKIILIIAACLLPIGIIATVLGVFFGGKTAWSVKLGNGGKSTVLNTVSDKVELKEFDSLSLDVSSIDVILKTGDSYSIEYTTREGREPVITEDHGKLTVVQPKDTNIMVFEFNTDPKSDTYMITVPEDAKEINIDMGSSSGEITIDRVKVTGDIEASSGDIMINDTEGKELNIKTSSGKIACDKIKVPKIDFHTSSGDIEILRMSTDSVKCSTSSGEVGINDSEAKEVECKTSSGDVEISLNGKEDDYSYDIDTSSGDIKVNGNKSDDDYRKEGGNNKISVTTSSGEVNITVE